jgi:ribosomal protein L11 methyltransferase
MIELFPEGFEEVAHGRRLELAAYTSADGATSIWRAFGEVSASDVADGWEDRWRRFHRGVRIGPLWVGPPWETPPGDATAVTIEPGRAFGTGAHETTGLCLELLLGFEPGSLLDVGCGSGVISIAAAKLGHQPVTAVDHDPHAVDAAVRNARRNGVDLTVRLADAFGADLPAVEVAVANLSLDAVGRLGERVGAAELVTSGYLASSLPEIPGFHHVARRERRGWAADRWRRG